MFLIRLLGVALLGVAMSAMARPFENKSSLDELLPAAQAFSLLPVERNGDTLHLSWNIAPGYYLSRHRLPVARSEAHTYELQSLMRISYAVFCLKKTKQNTKEI